MHTNFRSIFLAGILLFFASSLYGQDSQINIGAPFLTITPDARAAGYGDQGAATSPDNNAQYWNPAKYTFSNSKFGGAYSFTPWLKNISDDINLHFLSGFYKVDERQAVSASLRYFSLGNISFRDINDNVINDFKPNEFAFDIAYSRKLTGSLSAAIAFRYLRSDLTGSNSIPDLNIDTKAASAFAADIALYYQKQIEKNEYAAGVTISNIGPKISYSDIGDKSFIPTTLRIGARYTRTVGNKSKISGLLETSKLLIPTPAYENGTDRNADKGVIDGIFSSFSDAPGGLSEELKEFVYSIGAEYSYANILALRTGYFHEAEIKGNRKFFTYGLGVNYRMFTFDISYLAPANGGRNNPLDNTFRFALGFQIPK